MRVRDGVWVRVRVRVRVRDLGSGPGRVVRAASEPCVRPWVPGGAARCSAAITGPNQHSAVRYSPKRHASESVSVGAVSVPTWLGLG